jgi:amino acid transporter
MTDTTVKPVRPLTRSMGLVGVLFLALSATTPASSVFVVVPDVLAQAGSGALISMLAAALVAVCMAGVYGELGSAFPLAGGEYAIVGRTLGPLPGFVVMGLNLTNSLFGSAVLSLGVADYLGAAIPGLQPVPVALGVILCATLLGVLNIRTNALVTGGFLLVEILALVVLAALGFQHAHRSPMALLLQPQVLSGGVLSAAPIAALGLAVAVATFAYDGYGGALYFAEELNDAPRRVGRAIVIALLVTVAAEAIPLTAVLVGAPDLAHLLGAKSMFLDFIAGASGHGVALVLGLAIALAIVNAVIAIVLLTARQLYALGRDETWPGPVNGFLAKVHPRFGSPWAATLVTGALCCALSFAPLKLLLIATGTSVAIVYAFLCLGLIAGRRSGATRHGVFRLFGFPFTPLIALAALVGVLWSDWIDPAEGRTGLYAAIGVAAISAAYFMLVLQRRGWVLRGPSDQAFDSPLAAGQLPGAGLSPKDRADAG